jgi:hypothetical protein
MTTSAGQDGAAPSPSGEGPSNTRRYTRWKVIASLPSSSGNPRFVHSVRTSYGKFQKSNYAYFVRFIMICRALSVLFPREAEFSHRCFIFGCVVTFVFLVLKRAVAEIYCHDLVVVWLRKTGVWIGHWIYMTLPPPIILDYNSFYGAIAIL